MPRHKKLIHAIRHISTKEKRLFWIRFIVLSAFAILALIIGLFAHEVEHLSLALIGAKFADTCGEALAEALASVEE